MYNVIGLDLGGTYIKAAAVTADGHLAYTQEWPTQADKGPEAVIARMAEMARDTARAAGWEWADVAAVGAGIPGFIDFERGVVVWSGNIGWQEVPARQLLAEATGKHVEIENDANAAAIGERWLGAGRGSRNMVFVTVGTGIGGGLILGGRIYHGSSGLGGELGHIVLAADGDLCACCGQKGCLETLASATAMLRTARRLAPSYPGSQLAELAAANRLSIRQLAAAATNGDQGALEVFRRAGSALGRGLALIATALNPDMIVVGGGVSRTGELLLGPVREAFAATAMPGIVSAATLRAAELGNEAGVAGAARVALDVLEGQRREAA